MQCPPQTGVVTSFTGVITSLCVGVPPPCGSRLGQTGHMLTCHPWGMEGVSVHWLRDSLLCCCAVVFIIITDQSSDYQQQGVLAQDSPDLLQRGLQAAYSPLTSLSLLCAQYPDGEEARAPCRGGRRPTIDRGTQTGPAPHPRLTSLTFPHTDSSKPLPPGGLEHVALSAWGALSPHLGLYFTAPPLQDPTQHLILPEAFLQPPLPPPTSHQPKEAFPCV